jgi:hypothetical protein
MLLRPCSASIARRTSERSHARAPCAAAAAPAPALLAVCRAAVVPRGAIRPRAAGVHARRQRVVCSAAELPLAGGAAEPGAAAAEPLSAMLKYYAAFLVFGCAVNTIGPMLPSLAAHVGLTPVQMAPLLTAKGLGGLAGSFLCPLLPLVRRLRDARSRTSARSRMLTVSCAQAYLMPGGLLAISASFATIPVVTSLAQLALVYSFAAAVYQAVRARITRCTESSASLCWLHLRAHVILHAGQHRGAHAHRAAARRPRGAAPGTHAHCSPHLPLSHVRRSTERHQRALRGGVAAGARGAPHAVARCRTHESACVVLGHQRRGAAGGRRVPLLDCAAAVVQRAIGRKAAAAAARRTSPVVGVAVRTV